jgi:predicted regulator of Ras-like GTPase activity (Roadblock/LC7/MglB family)
MKSELERVLDDVLTIKGVLAAGVVDVTGEVLAAAEREPPGFADAGGLVAAALSASRVLGGFLGGGLEQAVIEYRGGPVVLTPVPRAPGATDPGDVQVVLALRLAALADLGRVRFQLPRLVAQLAAASRPEA